MRGRLHLLSRKCHVWIWKVVCPWTCLAAECVQACKKHRTASSCLGTVGESGTRIDRRNKL